ncbi:MAG: hypothetical protein A2Y24_02580 [Clostridiales bacterium GWE2_32_10]|nr:MAG: hypothetical protein A2Y24_02580 [Clostridiales bacterium GWE2_32_10]HBY21160.1 hypothetical protein [Clostridiales bacterium]
MKKEISRRDYWTDTIGKVTSAWNLVSGKTYKEIKAEKRALKDKVSELEIDIETLKIKLASTEIDLKASEIEKETIRMHLEEKKLQLVDLRLKLNQFESVAVTSDIEMNQILRRLKMNEDENEELKEKIFNIISMLCMMSEDEKYQDIIKIQTNTIDEIGNESHTINVTYAGQTVEIQTHDIMETKETRLDARTELSPKIINFTSKTTYAYDEEEDDDLLEQAE